MAQKSPDKIAKQPQFGNTCRYFRDQCVQATLHNLIYACKKKIAVFYTLVLHMKKNRTWFLAAPKRCASRSSKPSNHHQKILILNRINHQQCQSYHSVSLVMQNASNDAITMCITGHSCATDDQTWQLLGDRQLKPSKFTTTAIPL